MSKKKYADAVRQHRVVAIRRKSGPKSKSAIERIQTQESDGEKQEWTTAEAIQAMQAGTDKFFVVGTVWSPVAPWPPNNPKAMRTEMDRLPADDLQNLPTF